MLHRFSLLSAACLLVIASVSTAHADLTLTVTEPAKVAIVIPDKPDAAYTAASNLLAKRIEQALGRKVSIVKESAGSGLDLAFVLGPTAASLEALPDQGKLPDHGYQIKADGKSNVYFVAKDDFAVGFAVTEFAERILNIRQYMPAPLGECITKTDRVVIPADFSYISMPDYASVWLSGVYTTGRDTNVTPFKEMDQAFQTNWSDQFHHAMHDIFPPEKYGKTHPEYYPERNGKRLVPLTPEGKPLNSSWQPCLTNPEVRAIVLQHCLDYFKANPSATSVSIAINDGGGYCQCDKCMAMEKKYGGFSGLYFDFANQIARELDKAMPGKKVGFLRYGEVTTPPPFPIAKNVLIYYTHPGADGLVPWVKAGASVGVYTWLYGFNYVTPRFYPHEFQTYMKRWKEQGAVGLYAEGYPNWIVDAPMLYEAVKIARHLDADPDAILKQYASDMFGPAADDIVKFYAVTERAMERRKDQKLDNFESFSEISRPIIHQFLCWRADDVAQIDAALADAAGKVAPGSLQAQRLGLLRTYWAWSRAYILAYAQSRDIGAKPCKTVADAEALMPLIEQLNGHVADINQQWITKLRDINNPRTVQSVGIYLRSALDPNYWQSVVGNWIDPSVWPYVSVDQKFAEFRQSLSATMKPEQVAQTFQKLAVKYPAAAPYLTTQSTLALGNLFNLVSNPSFEELDPLETEHRTPQAFKIWMSRSSYQKDVGVVDGQARTGKRSFHQGEGGGAWLDRTVTVQSNARYLVRVWVRKNTPDTGAQMNFVVFDKTGNITKLIYNVLTPDDTRVNQWQPIEAIVSIPDNCDKLSVDIYVKSQEEGQDTWFDDMVIARVD